MIALSTQPSTSKPTHAPPQTIQEGDAKVAVLFRKLVKMRRYNYTIEIKPSRLQGCDTRVTMRHPVGKFVAHIDETSYLRAVQAACDLFERRIAVTPSTKACEQVAA